MILRFRNFLAHRRSQGKSSIAIIELVTVKFSPILSPHLSQFHKENWFEPIRIRFDPTVRSEFLLKIERSSETKPTENLISPARIIPLPRSYLLRRFSFGDVRTRQGTVIKNSSHLDETWKVETALLNGALLTTMIGILKIFDLT